MQRRSSTFFFVSLACLVLLASPAGAFSTGPPNYASWCGNDGTLPVCGNPPCFNCTACHNDFNVNEGTGMVDVVNVPAEWSRGQTYQMTVVLQDINNPTFNDDAGADNGRGGLELATLLASDRCQAGDLTEIAPNTVVQTAPDTTQWLKHNFPQNATGGLAMWDFMWAAPSTAGQGDVELSVCGNAASGDGDGNDNDYIYCTSFLIPEATSLPEDCANGIDDDGDTLVDCEDTDDCPAGTACQDDGEFCTGTESCDGAAMCRSSGDPCQPGETCDEAADQCVPAGTEDCANGVDDDGDTLVDCEDTADCPQGTACEDDGAFCTGTESCDASAMCVSSGDPCQPGETCDELTNQCLPGGTEDCTNGTDDDGDGDADCDDSDCFCEIATCPDADCDGDIAPNSADCAPSDAENIIDPTGVDVPFLGVIKIAPDFLLLYWTNFSTTDTSDPDPSQWFPGFGRATVYDAVRTPIADLTALPEPYQAAECLGDDIQPQDFPLPLGEAGTPGQCGDGVDNDGDGLVDCDDPECGSNATDCGAGAETNAECANLIDDDGDGRIDCLDSNCAFDAFCIAVLGILPTETIDDPAYEVPNSAPTSAGNNHQLASYLIRAQNDCGTGTYGDSSITPDPRDFLDASGPCP